MHIVSSVAANLPHDSPWDKACRCHSWGEIFGGERDATANFNGDVQFLVKPNVALEAAGLTTIGSKAEPRAKHLKRFSK